jgi:hypothetical protein
MPTKPHPLEEYHILVKRYLHFENLWDLYNDFLSGRYIPSVNTHSSNVDVPEMADTLLIVLYSWFYSLVDDEPRGVDAFRAWYRFFPEDKPAIRAVQKQIKPIKSCLKTLRNRVGFHGSQTWEHENAAFDLFKKQSAEDVIGAMNSFRSLARNFLEKAVEVSGLG